MTALDIKNFLAEIPDEVLEKLKVRIFAEESGTGNASSISIKKEFIGNPNANSVLLIEEY